ncbi:protein of unknown function [Magnetospira sp. QH-2]|nr:protein of unknown function [Magnetospira sp. QH-2]
MAGEVLDHATGTAPDIDNKGAGLIFTESFYHGAENISPRNKPPMAPFHIRVYLIKGRLHAGSPSFVV